MKPAYKVVLVCAGILLCLVIGFVGGIKLGTSEFRKERLRANAWEVSFYTHLLRLLDAGNSEKAEGDIRILLRSSFLGLCSFHKENYAGGAAGTSKTLSEAAQLISMQEAQFNVSREKFAKYQKENSEVTNTGLPTNYDEYLAELQNAVSYAKSLMDAEQTRPPNP